MKTVGWFVGVVLLGAAAAGAAPALGQERAVTIMGVVQEIAPQAGLLIVREGLRGKGGQRTIQLGPEVRVLKLRRDRAHGITTERAAADQIRRGDFVHVIARGDGARLRALEVQISPENGS